MLEEVVVVVVTRHSSLVTRHPRHYLPRDNRQGVSALSGLPKDEISVLIGTAFERKLDFLRKYFQNRGGQFKKIFYGINVCRKSPVRHF